MKVSYTTTKLEKVCTNSKKLVKAFGSQVAERIRECIQALDAAESLDQLPQRLRPHPREPKHEEVFQIDVLKHKHPTRLFFKPDGEYEIEAYATIKEVVIINISKTHS